MRALLQADIVEHRYAADPRLHDALHLTYLQHAAEGDPSGVPMTVLDSRNGSPDIRISGMYAPKANDTNCDVYGPSTSRGQHVVVGGSHCIL